ncbi:hypothetical protein [Tannockella kyphosi]|uniref:hypothetical protein n=1 Tax=Tannockella kyphosi TaxID=2899121 RepID=UPI002012A5EC|nr:hypothetical protein [Tannockella kyphosi]
MVVLRKHRFKILFSFVLVLVLGAFAFLYCVHIPYVENQSNLITIRNQILEDNQLVYDDYFYQYSDENIYYIIRVLQSDTSTYLVYDQYLNELDSFRYDVKEESFIQEVFFSRYSVECGSIEVAYENERFVYFVKYTGEEGLIYAYYDLYSGQFIKGIQL